MRLLPSDPYSIEKRVNMNQIDWQVQENKEMASPEWLSDQGYYRTQAMIDRTQAVCVKERAEADKQIDELNECEMRVSASEGEVRKARYEQHLKDEFGDIKNPNNEHYANALSDAQDIMREQSRGMED